MMEYMQTENEIERLVADSSHSKESELCRMQLNSTKEKQLPTEQRTEQNYEKRISTFVSWPYENVISHKKLAKAGFFYEGNGDEVQCYSCGVKVKGWKPSDIAVRKHQELSPHCNYIASIFNKASRQNNAGLIDNVLNSPQVQGFSTSSNRNRSSLVGTPSTSLRISTNVGEAMQTVLPSSESITVGSSQNQSIGMSSGTGSVERSPDFEKMKSEEERLKTFSFGWPLMSPKPCDLAREGFFYLFEKDRVQCAFCRGIVSRWESTDDPLREHARHFAFCPFVMGRNVGNIPSNKYSPSYNKGIDVCGSRYWKNSGPENGTMPILEKKIEKLENFGVKLHHGPKHPAQASKDARMRSFVGWPISSPIQPKTLVEAGFFYIGIQDYTRCFYCDGGLCNWEANDDPWEEHARWFQHCAYVRLNKGDAWVEACLKKGSVQKSTSQAPISQQHNIPTTLLIDIPSKVEELMNSDIITSAVELDIFPVDLIKAALLKRIQTVGSNFSNHEELCESVFNLQEEIEQNNSTSTSGTETGVESIVKSIKENENSLPVPNCREIKDNVKPSVEDIIKEQKLCKICMDKEIGVLFLPCGHLMSCVECGPAMTTCPFCRQTIRGTVRAFLT